MTHIDETHLDTLVLVRLAVVPARKALSRRDVARSVLPVLRGALDQGKANEAIAASLERLASNGLREPDKMRATAEGGRRARAAIGVERGPLPASWREAKKLFVALALGMPAGRESRARLRDADALRAEVLRQRLGLPGTTKLTFAAALNAWAARELGLTGKAFTFANVRAHLLGRAIGLDSPRSSVQVAAVAVAKLADARSAGATEISDALLRNWLRGAPADARPAAPSNARPANVNAAPPLDRFADAVRVLAREEKSARFGRDKVFISSLWKRAQAIPELRVVDEPTFKSLLVDAHRAGLLHLSRADLTSAMSPTMVRDSEVTYLNAVFHFVNDEAVQ